MPPGQAPLDAIELEAVPAELDGEWRVGVEIRRRGVAQRSPSACALTKSLVPPAPGNVHRLMSGLP